LRDLRGLEPKPTEPHAAKRPSSLIAIIAIIAIVAIVAIEIARRREIWASGRSHEASDWASRPTETEPRQGSGVVAGAP